MNKDKEEKISMKSITTDKRLWIIFLIVFVNLLGFGIIMPLLPYYAEAFGAGPIMIGLITAAYSFFQILSAPILGELSDKYGRRPVLMFSIFGTAVSFLLLGFAHSIPILFLSRIIDGITGGNISTAQAYIADITTEKDRTRGMGFMMAAFSLGLVLGPALGGLLSVYGYSVPAFVAGGVAMIATICTFFFLPESYRAKSNIATIKQKRHQLFKLKNFFDAITHPNVGLLLRISFVTMLAFSLMQGTFALYTEHSLNLSARTNGMIFAYLGLVGILVQVFLLKKILQFFSEPKILVLSTVLMAVGLGLISFSSNTIMLVVAITLLALASSISRPVIAGNVSKLVPADEQGNIAGMDQSVGGVARLFGPLIGTMFFSLMGVKSPFIIATVLLALTAVYASSRFGAAREFVSGV